MTGFLEAHAEPVEHSLVDFFPVLVGFGNGPELVITTADSHELRFKKRSQRAIDNAKDEKEAIEDSTKKFIDGLTNALDKERQLYENN